MQVYPLVTWLAQWPSFTVSVRIDGTTTALNVPDGVGYGWRTTGAEAVGIGGLTGRLADAGSMAAVIAGVLATHPNAGPVAAYYGSAVSPWAPVQAGSGTVGYALDWNPSANDAVITATSDAASLALFGLRVGDLIDQVALVNRRTAGVWRPTSTEGAVIEPVYTAIGSGAWSPYDASARDRILLSGALTLATTWTYVEAADISQRLLAIGNYGPLASRAPGDTAGTLDDLLYAAARNGALTLALTPSPETAAIDYQECILATSGDLTRDAYTTPVSIGSRRYTVTLPLRSTTPYVPS